jgi:hypothetical protein
MGKKVLRDRNSYFGVIPLWLYDSGASLQAAATFGYIQGRYGGSKYGIFPSLATLAKGLKVSERSVRSYLAELEKVRAIRVTRRGFNKSNWYELASDGPFSEESDADNKKNDGSSGLGTGNP